MTEPETIRRLLARVIADNGGPAASRMASAYHAGRTLESIAAEHGVSPATVHRRIGRLTEALDSVGCLPDSWRSRDQPRRAVSPG